jgi:hypothetical protein
LKEVIDLKEEREEGKEERKIEAILGKGKEEENDDSDLSRRPEWGLLVFTSQLIYM